MNYSTVTTVLKRSPVEIALIALFALVTIIASTPNTFAAGSPKDNYTDLAVQAMQNLTLAPGKLPTAKLTGDYQTMRVPATAYNSLPEQTDSTPFITAAGTHVRHGIVAANFLPLGTQITIPEIYGDQIFTVEDRMNARYNKKVDIWMEHYSDARAFGLKNIEIRIYSAN